MPTAITRPINSTLADCELTHIERRPIDLELARRQHAGYEAALRDAGYAIDSLPEAPDHPDAVFVEDVAIVLPELAILTRPGARSRRGERATIEPALARYRDRVERIVAPGTLDGGDVLRRGTTVFVGRSTRTDPDAIDQLGALIEPLGYEVIGVEVRGCMHLKSAATTLLDDRLLINPALIDAAPFGEIARIEVDPGEPAAANVLLAGGRTLASASYPRTTRRLRDAGYDVRPVELSEMEKAEAALTCCSILVD